MSEASVDETTYCTVHPVRATGLRCNRCGRYMCTQCAVSTPVGYRCRECVLQVDDKFLSGTNSDYLIAFGRVALAAGLGGLLLVALRLTGILLLIFFVAVPVGGALAQLVFKAVGGRRGRYTAPVAATGVIIGAAVAAFLMRGYTSIGL